MDSNRDETKVALRPCADYDIQRLKTALEQAIRDIGGLGAYLIPGKKVLLKVNLILGKGPELAATTHPNFVLALGTILQEYSMEVIIGDSPGGPFNAAALKRIYQVTGMTRVAEEGGFTLNRNTESMEVSNPEGLLMKKLTMTAMLSDVDYVISVSKLKTHSMMTYTGAAKNMFGTIPGTVKADYHVRMPAIQDFSNALVDICEAAHPVLSFMDAVVGMEGNGPSAGTPRKVGAVLASGSPYALDQTAAGLIGLRTTDVPLLARAVERGLLHPDETRVIAADPAAFTIPDYKLPDHIESDLYRMKMPGWVAAPLKKITRAKVHFDEKRCIGCGVCAANCPPKAIAMQGKGSDRHPHVDHRQCIRCFCCQELCPKEAVQVKESFIYRIANRL